MRKKAIKDGLYRGQSTCVYRLLEMCGNLFQTSAWKSLFSLA